MIRISLPLEKRDVEKLKAGDEVLLSGLIYTARDQAHKRLVELIKKGKKLPLELKNQIIYYCGPTATPLEKIIGSCGPTSSLRMDEFTEPLLRRGLKGIIGKGRRSAEIRRLLRRHIAVYLIAPSGCGAYLAGKVKNRKVLAFKELGPEAILQLRVEDFPLIVGIDCRGESVYEDF